MKNSKLEAILHLENAFAHNKEFKKAWTDYIELVIIEQLEECKANLPQRMIRKIATSSSERIIGLFSADWWRHQKYVK